MRRFAILVSLFFLACLSGHAQYAQGKGWAEIQSSAFNVVSGCFGPATTCTALNGVIEPTQAGSVWLMHVQTTNNVTITNVTGGGATWAFGAHVTNPSGFTSNVWYGLGGAAGTKSGITFTLSSSSGNVLGANFIELAPPPGSTASLDVVNTATPTSCSTCSLPTITTSANSLDIIWTNPGGTGTASWNSCSAPYITAATGDCYAPNVTGTVAGTKQIQGTGNPNYIAIAFKSTAGNPPIPASQYTVVQFKASGVTNCNPNCTIPTAQTTGVGNLLYLVSYTGGAFISSLPAGWVIPATCRINGTIIGQGNGMACAYKLSSTAISSVAVTMTGNASSFFALWEVSAPTGWTWNAGVVSAATNSNDGSNTPANFFNNGIAITLSMGDTNAVVFQNEVCVGGNYGPNYFLQPQLPNNSVAMTGPANYFALNDAASTILTDTGPTAPTPTWLNPQHDTTLVNASEFWATAPTVNLADCNAGTVTAAITAVTVDQTSLQCPTGTYVWNANGGTTLQNSNFGYHLNGTTTVAGTCAPGGTCTPSDGTIIQLSTSNHSNGSACDTQGNGGGCTNVTINLTSGKMVEISGIAWQSTTAFPGYGKIAINGNGSCLFRFDHNHINDNTSGDHFINIDNTCGVLDHNFFDSTSLVDTFFIQPTINGPDGNANQAWTRPENFGSSNFLYIENNQFQDGWFVDDCNYGAFMTLRFNIVGTNTSLQSHGVGSGAQRRGCRAMETYQNSFQFSPTPNGNCAGGHGSYQSSGSCPNPTTANVFFSMLEDYETGTGMWWGNSVAGFQKFLRQQNVRSNSATYTQTATPNGWGFCGTQFNGTGSPWDSNSIANTGYPCLDQIGYGAGDLLTGVFACPSCTPPTPATLTNSATGCLVGTFGSSCSGYPRQARVPTYAWSNNITPLSPVPTGGNLYWNLLGGQSTESADYYLERPNENNAAIFNGTGGVGCGPSSSPSCTNPVARPATCTTGVAYWNVNEGSWNQSGSGGQGALDICTSTNTWTNAVYVPFTYPHPLVVGGTIGGGNFPSLTVTPNPVAFGNQLVSTTSSPITVTVTNVGTAAEILSAPYFTITGSNVGSFQNTSTGTCLNSGSINAGSSCTVILTFTPSSPGAASATLNINGNALGSTLLTGTGTPSAPIASWNPTNFSFGSVLDGNTSVSSNLTLSNTGGSALNVSLSFTGANPSSFSIFSSTCGSTVASNGSCNVVVQFAPTTANNFSANLTETDSTNSIVVNLALTGTGIATAPVVSLNPTSLAFGAQPINTTSGISSSVLTNTGTAALTITSVTLTGVNVAQFAFVVPISGNDCRTVGTVAVGFSCSIAVVFTPNSTTTFSASVSISDNAAGSPHSIPLTGTGFGTAAPAPSFVKLNIGP